jgi:hypothetical protein
VSFEETAIARFTQSAPQIAVEGELELSRGRSTLAAGLRSQLLSFGSSLVSDEHGARLLEGDLLYRVWTDGVSSAPLRLSALRLGVGLAYRTMIVTDGAYGYSNLLGPAVELSAFRDNMEASASFSPFSAQFLPQSHELRARVGVLLRNAQMKAGPELEWGRLAYRTGPGATMSQSTWTLSWRWRP